MKHAWTLRKNSDLNTTPTHTRWSLWDELGSITLPLPKFPWCSWQLRDLTPLYPLLQRPLLSPCTPWYHISSIQFYPKGQQITLEEPPTLSFPHKITALFRPGYETSYFWNLLHPDGNTPRMLTLILWFSIELAPPGCCNSHTGNALQWTSYNENFIRKFRLQLKCETARVKTPFVVKLFYWMQDSKTLNRMDLVITSSLICFPDQY